MVKSVKKVLKKSEVYAVNMALLRLSSRNWKLNVGHRLALNVRFFKGEVETLNEVRDKLSEEHVLRDADGKKVSSEGEDGFGWVLKDPAEFREIWDEFLKEEMEVSVYPINVSDFGKNFELPPVDFESLEGAGVLIMDLDEHGKTPKKKPKKEEQTSES